MQNLPPISCISVGVCSNRNSLVSVVMEKQVLMPAILRCDLNAVQNILDQLKGEILHSLSSSMWYMVMTPYLLPFIFLLVFFLHPALPPPLSLSPLLPPRQPSCTDSCTEGVLLWRLQYIPHPGLPGKTPRPFPLQSGREEGCGSPHSAQGGHASGDHEAGYGPSQW